MVDHVVTVHASRPCFEQWRRVAIRNAEVVKIFDQFGRFAKPQSPIELQPVGAGWYARCHLMPTITMITTVSEFAAAAMKIASPQRSLAL
jgi:hypothetical protein